VIDIYLEFYKTTRGDNPVMEYILSIEKIDEVADIMETIERIDRKGAKYLTSGAEFTVPLGSGLWEIKKSKNRIYYIYCKQNRVFFLHACYKQKGKAEKKDIIIGKKRMKEIKEREEK